MLQDFQDCLKSRDENSGSVALPLRDRTSDPMELKWNAPAKVTIGWCSHEYRKVGH